jgi:hypothetical protein
VISTRARHRDRSTAWSHDCRTTIAPESERRFRVILQRVPDADTVKRLSPPEQYRTEVEAQRIEADNVPLSPIDENWFVRPNDNATVSVDTEQLAVAAA